MDSTWFQIVQLLVSLLLGGIGVQLIRTRPMLKKIANDREANLLQERAEEMQGMRQQLILMDVELRFERHRNSNLAACFDSLIMLLKQDPSKAAEAAQMVMDMRANQIAAEALEKAEIMGRLAAQTPGKEPPNAERT
jgi:hypothetical protein